MTEIWRPIKDYENIYEVSNLGRVRSLERTVIRKNGVTLKVPEKILKPKARRDGYLTVNIYKNAVCKNYYIHRVVSTAFLPNPDNKPQVNHLSEEKTDNSVENLEWCTAKENVNYGTGIQRGHEKLGKPILCIELNQIFPSVTDAARQLSLSKGNLGSVLAGRRKSAGGYHFEYVEAKAAI